MTGYAARYTSCRPCALIQIKETSLKDKKCSPKIQIELRPMYDINTLIFEGLLAKAAIIIHPAKDAIK